MTRRPTIWGDLSFQRIHRSNARWARRGAIVFAVFFALVGGAVLLFDETPVAGLVWVGLGFILSVGYVALGRRIEHALRWNYIAGGVCGVAWGLWTIASLVVLGVRWLANE